MVCWMRVWARVSGSVLGVSSAIAVLAKASRLRWPSGVRFEVIVLRILASAGFMSLVVLSTHLAPRVQSGISLRLPAHWPMRAPAKPSVFLHCARMLECYGRRICSVASSLFVPNLALGHAVGGLWMGKRGRLG